MLQQYLHQYQCTEEHCSLVGSMWLVLQMESSAQCGMQLGGGAGGLGSNVCAHLSSWANSH